jgi:hypothetical protein
VRGAYVVQYIVQRACSLEVTKVQRNAASFQIEQNKFIVLQLPGPGTYFFKLYDGKNNNNTIAQDVLQLLG